MSSRSVMIIDGCRAATLSDLADSLLTFGDTNMVGQFTPAVRAGGFIFVAGQTPRDGDRKVIGRTIEEQTEVTLRNVEYVLEAAGSKLQDVVKVTAYLQDLTMFPQFNE